MVKTVLAFLLGAAAGGAGVYLYLDKRSIKNNTENAEKNRNYYETKIIELEKEIESLKNPDEKIEETDSTEPDVDIPEAKRKADDLAAKLNYNALYNKQPLGSNAPAKDPDDIFLISPEQYESETLYDRRTLTYYEGDDILCDELTDDVMDVENTIGLENLMEFGNGFEDDPYIMHIRNNTYGAVYEVIKDERSYSAVMGDENG